MFILLMFELFMIDILIEGSVDKKDDSLLLQQIDFSDDGIHPNEKGHEKIFKAIKVKGEISKL